METKMQELGLTLRRLASCLETDDVKPGDDHEGSGFPPHLEMIDFDLLGQALMQAADGLERLDTLQPDAEAVRNWLVVRMKAMRRTEAILTGQQAKEDDATPSQELSLTGLLRRFEEETARLQGLAQARPARTGPNDRKKYQAYKS